MSSTEQDYPSLLPLEGVQEIIRIVRAGTVISERSAFAKHAWNLQGYLQKVALGEPTPLIGSVPDTTDSESLAALESLKSRAYATAEGVTPTTIALPVQAILHWLVNKLLTAILSAAT